MAMLGADLKISLDGPATIDFQSYYLAGLSRYLAVSATVILTYDTLLSFQSEHSLIWKDRLSFPKVAYFSYRYLMAAAILLYLYSSFPSIGPLRDSEMCKRLAQTISIVMFSADAIGHFLVIFRTFILWERNTKILRLLILGSITVNVSSIICLVLSALSVSGEALWFQEGPNVCTAETQPRFVLGIWLSQAAFDIYVLFLILWNAMDRPRLSSQRLLQALDEDGLLLIITTWVVRMVNVVLCLRDDAILSIISISFTESLITAINLKLLRHTFEANQGVRSATRDSSIELRCLLEV